MQHWLWNLMFMIVSVMGFYLFWLGGLIELFWMAVSLVLIFVATFITIRWTSGAFDK